MAGWSRVLTALTEDSSSALSTHVAGPRDPAPLLAFLRHCMHVVYRHRLRCTHVHRKLNNTNVKVALLAKTVGWKGLRDHPV